MRLNPELISAAGIRISLTKAPSYRIINQSEVDAAHRAQRPFSATMRRIAVFAGSLARIDSQLKIHTNRHRASPSVFSRAAPHAAASAGACSNHSTAAQYGASERARLRRTPSSLAGSEA